MSNKIQKPLSVARAEFIGSLTDLINNSALPPFIIEPILKDMYSDIHLLSQKQFEADNKRYQEQLEQSQEEQN